MLKKKINTYLILALSIISLTLISAFIIEYYFGHKPCKLCIYERIPYAVSIFLIIKILFYKKYEKIIILVISIIFILSAILAFYHFGIEQGFFIESFACKSENALKELSKEQLLEALKETNISCKDVSLKILGVSLAAINIILSLFMSFLFFILFLTYNKKL
jgi:disulfide bond formation protein DsbB